MILICFGGMVAGELPKSGLDTECVRMIFSGPVPPISLSGGIARNGPGASERAA